MADEELFAGCFEEPEGFLEPDPEPTTETFVVKSDGANFVVNLVAKHSLWAHCMWNAGKFFADYYDTEFSCEGKRFLELGAGASLPSIFAARKGAKLVVATDYPDEELVDNVKLNLKNHCADVKGSVVGMGYRWGDSVEPLLQAMSGETEFDVIIMADLIFNHFSHPELLQTAKMLLAPKGEVHVAFSHHRPQFEKEDMNFFTLAQEEPFNFKVRLIRSVKTEPMFENDPGDKDVRSTIHFYTLTR
eukprot:GCRY01001502.1.p1 GENE.GCRY01001502.1~~GCRY01001502.1.p1  ORF type:complete len:246 (+),score=51.98 GCRY01001502.1:78-815(+)